MNRFKKILFCCLTAVLMIMITSCGMLNSVDKKQLIETECGDKFSMSYDSYNLKSLVEHNDSRFNIVLKGKITEDDIKLLSSSDEFKVYRFMYMAVYDTGNGFTAFHGEEDTEPSVISVIKENLLSDDAFFAYNIGYFLDSSKYASEAQQIIISLCNGEYDKLTKYGLNVSASDNEDLKSITQKAQEIKKAGNKIQTDNGTLEFCHLSLFLHHSIEHRYQWCVL